MALKQIRRTVSLNAGVHRALLQHAHALGVSASSFIENLISTAIPGIERHEYRPKQPRAQPERLVPESEWRPAFERALAAARKQVAAEKAQKPKSDEVVNPCRRERCPWMRLHEEGSCL